MIVFLIMGQNNFKKLLSEREQMLPDDLEFQVMREASTLGHFGDIVSLFVLNTVASVAHLVTGGEDPKCITDRRARIRADMEERNWCQPQNPEDEMPSAHGKRIWIHS
jgi:hypothetical protein